MTRGAFRSEAKCTSGLCHVFTYNLTPALQSQEPLSAWNGRLWSAGGSELPGAQAAKRTRLHLMKGALRSEQSAVSEKLEHPLCGKSHMH